MGVVVLHNPKSRAGKRLRKSLETMDLGSQVQYYENISSLFGSLKLSAIKQGIAVLQITGKQELDAIVAAGELFINQRLVLILPDQQPETIAKGHLLYPRFVIFADGDIEQIDTVLEKMLALSGNRRSSSRMSDYLVSIQK